MGRAQRGDVVALPSQRIRALAPETCICVHASMHVRAHRLVTARATEVRTRNM